MILKSRCPFSCFCWDRAFLLHNVLTRHTGGLLVLGKSSKQAKLGRGSEEAIRLRLESKERPILYSREIAYLSDCLSEELLLV